MQVGQSYQFPQETLNQVKENMQRPEGIRHRQNTGNTGYGFVQLIDDDNDFILQQPNGMGVRKNINGGVYDPTLDGPNEYQFVAPGNVGALRQPANMHKGALKYKNEVMDQM